TGLYFNALLKGLGEAPPADPAIRAELEKAPLPDLLTELKRRDPSTWEKIDRQNPRRIIRALEVIRVSGRPFSEQRAQWAAPETKLIGLEMARDDLHARINQRVDAMFRAGLVEETKNLTGLRENKTASQALGYQQVLDHLDGKLSLAETIDLIKLR